MAEFCKQCSIYNFGEDYNDFAYISHEVDTANKRYAAVLCEGCGPTLVDHEGLCVAKDCLEKHGVDQ